ncbi:hypothetical protein Ddc_11638 [Ditylenchus destructor]|nr:hypothetical protein Ddc_11638 [Ditylenchus destructor]
MFRLCNSEKVPNIHLIQLCVLEPKAYEHAEASNSVPGRDSAHRARTVIKTDITTFDYRIFLNPTQHSLDMVTFCQLPLSCTDIIRFGRVVLLGSLHLRLFAHLVKMKHMFERCRLEIVYGYFNAQQILNLFDKIQLSECVIFCRYYYSHPHSSFSYPSSILLTPVLDADKLDMSEGHILKEVYSLSYRSFDFWRSKYLIKEVLEWLHYREGHVKARRHLILKESLLSANEDPIYKIEDFLDEIVQRFRSALIPCNFMVTWLSPTCTEQEPLDLFNNTTSERLSLLQRDGEPNIFRLWRRQCTLESFNTLLPAAGDKTNDGNVWKHPFYHHGFVEKLQRSRDIPRLPLGYSTKRRLRRFQIMSRRRAPDINEPQGFFANLYFKKVYANRNLDGIPKYDDIRPRKPGHAPKKNYGGLSLLMRR